MKNADIVVLGAGLGGISMVFDLKAELGKNHRIILVNKTESFQFTPSNPGSASAGAKRVTSPSSWRR
jgi:sulfide:quinone oxidoreductase